MIKKIKSLNKVNNIVNIQSVQNSENISLKNMDGYFEEKFYFSDIYDDKKMKALLSSIKKQVRGSEEYANYIGFLKNDLGLDHCAVLGNIEKDDATLEFHHYPFTIHDIIYLNVSRNILLNKKFNSFSVAQDVLKDHYNNIIGVVPLSLTVHQLAHAGQVFISLNSVYGDLNAFMDKYSFAMTDEMIDKFNMLVDYTEKNIPYSENDVLKKIYDIEEAKRNV
jgi:hypothetical protein